MAHMGKVGFWLVEKDRVSSVQGPKRRGLFGARAQETCLFGARTTLVCMQTRACNTTNSMLTNNAGTQIDVGCRVTEADLDYGDGTVESDTVSMTGVGFNVGGVGWPVSATANACE